jgi:hypothetical protein
VQVFGWLTLNDLTDGAKTIVAHIEHLLFDDTEIWMADSNPAPVVPGPVTGATVQVAGVLVVDANAVAFDALTAGQVKVLHIAHGVTVGTTTVAAVVEVTVTGVEECAVGSNTDIGVTK